MIAVNIRRLAVYLVLSFAVVAGGLSWWQVVDAQHLATRQDNPQVIAARRSAPRGSIFDARGLLLASSVVVDGTSRRSYRDPAFGQVIGYASLRYGTTGVERAWDDLLTGRADPNPMRELLDQILARRPESKDLTLTIDQRLQDFVAAQLGSNQGAVVALDPRTGAVLAMVSSPSFDATGFSGDPETAQAAWDAVAGDLHNPFVDRVRQGHYTPGSIMKILTAAAALDAGAITPQTTFPDQPRQETEGFLVDGFTIHEHNLGRTKPALWALSPALQVFEQHLLRARWPGAGRRALPGLRPPLRLLQLPAARHWAALPHRRSIVRLSSRRWRLRSVRRPGRAGQRRLRAGAGRRHAPPDGPGGRNHRERWGLAAAVRGA